MVVDSGSSRTAISDEAAQILGVAVQALEREPIAGATGGGLRPVIRNLLLRLGVPGFTPIRLERVTVLDPSLETPGPPRALPLALRRVARGGLNIFGTDVARILGARVALDYETFNGEIRW